MNGHRVEANEIIRLSGLYEAIAEALADRDREANERVERCHRQITELQGELICARLQIMELRLAMESQSKARLMQGTGGAATCAPESASRAVRAP